ncbi:MAG: UDP-N-acetylmuramoyl-L-alanyl-D-glutamate--2 6-diaminopimelate ligase [Halothiobacillaceae bacterium]|nr:MAG: UDP-N-acetylmuramoyl-L-alanyl-D-glutamate--2 6-diaminopimelate ligase [Halothiobacillaceae bacterium]
MAAILAGVPKSVTATVIHDRTTAIHYAFTRAAVQDTILIAGKGHEEYQEISGQRYPYSDRQVAATLVGTAEGVRL